MKILFAASEACPFIVTGGLGEVVGALPTALASLGDADEKEMLEEKNGTDHKNRPAAIGENVKNDVRVILPLYGKIQDKYRSEMNFLGYIYVSLSWRNQYCGIFSYKKDNVIYYFIDNEYYFKRETVYGHFDDGERFAFFSKAILDVLKFVDFQPDIIHANDWQTGLVPIYLNLLLKGDPFYSHIKTVFTIHNIEYQGEYGKEILTDVFGLPAESCSLIECNGCANLVKGAIVCSDFVGTVSPTYAEEIQDGYYAHGLDWVLRDASYKLKGILNGIDVASYNPQTDPWIAANYTAEDITGKKMDKLALQREFGLPERDDVPLIGMVTRLASHKGLDLLTFIFDQLMEEDIQLVLVGTGEFSYEDYFYKKAQQHKIKFGIRIDFDTILSKKVYAGSDFFLMPSKSEPCGLAQMMAMRYGTIPIVRQTGGLKDSVRDYGDPEGTGFTFKSYNAHDMLGAIKRALGLYQDKTLWKELVVHDMKQDFSWDASAKEYLKLYERVLKG